MMSRLFRTLLLTAVATGAFAAGVRLLRPPSFPPPQREPKPPESDTTQALLDELAAMT